jgi:hypothetical protein
MSKRRQRQRSQQSEPEQAEQFQHAIIARGSGTWTNPLIRCSCEAKINEGIKLTADKVFQLHRDAASPNT